MMMIVLSSRVLRLPLISLSRESTAARTAMIEKIPMVTPSSERKVRNLLFLSALIAKLKLSLSSLRYINIENSDVLTPDWVYDAHRGFSLHLFSEIKEHIFRFMGDLLTFATLTKATK